MVPIPDIPPGVFDWGVRYYHFLNEDGTPGKWFDYTEIAMLFYRGIDIGWSIRRLPFIPSPHLPVLRVEAPEGTDASHYHNFGALNGFPEDVLRATWSRTDGAPGANWYGANWRADVKYYAPHEAYERLADYPADMAKMKPVEYVPPSAPIGRKVAVVLDERNLSRFIASLARETKFRIFGSTTVVVEI